uniref:Uncharacterized protein n=1 Tax=Ananas comosus var. bracteatus TaxID=296719 RepID=A0A6V7NG46_ANACO|nr:unnamed protein product [Ananas comosus var. bracteatus]
MQEALKIVPEGGQLEGDNANKKYNKILEASQSQLELSNIELIEKCFGTQCRQHVVCYGGGVKSTDLKPSYSSRAELNAKLCETQKENQSLRSRMDGMEAELQKIKEMLQQHHNISHPSSPSEGN